jgi:hypothetical protein
MKNRILHIILGLLFALHVQSQINPPVEKVRLSEHDIAILNGHIKQYVTFYLEKSELVDSLYKIGKTLFRLNIDKERDWTVELQFNDMRSPDYVATYETEKDVFKYEDYILNTFKGYTSDGKIARFTIDKDNFFGVILNKETHFVIRPTKDLTHNEKDESLIVYESSDLIPEENSGDYIEDAIKTSESEKSQLQSTSDSSPIFNDCPVYLGIATDADLEFYQDNGYNLNSTYNAVFTVLNVVEGVYESTFNMRFVVTFQNVYTSSSNPYGTINSSNLLSTFRDYWQSNRTNVPRHIAHLFTGKELDGTYNGTVGKAYTGHIRDSYAYGLSQNHSNLNSITAHEIGHNFNAGHASNSNCQCSYANSSIMCASSSTPHSLWFCDESVNQIENCMMAVRLVPICYYGVDAFGLGTTLNLNGSISGVREYFSGQTINSSQVINSGIIKYNAGTGIILSPGFHAQQGATFEAKIDDISACNPITEAAVYICFYIMQSNAPADNEILASLEDAVGLPRSEDIDFIVYPNPNDSNFTVKIMGEIQPYTVEIFNNVGAKIGSVNCHTESTSINRTDLSHGTYFLKLTVSNQTIVKKLIVK